MYEDKQAICRALRPALKLTRNHYDLVDIRYAREGDKETVTVYWAGGARQINVSMDSGSAMIRDIMKNID